MRFSALYWRIALASTLVAGAWNGAHARQVDRFPVRRFFAGRWR
ncbi:MAG: hypothetical protein RQ826_09805 [Xanthomonadales bacterium]|nr:hypothetical protein [Xanthomonadales bacterium]